MSVHDLLFFWKLLHPNITQQVGKWSKWIREPDMDTSKDVIVVRVVGKTTNKESNANYFL